MDYETYKNKQNKLYQKLFDQYMSDSLDKKVTYMGRKVEDVDFETYRLMLPLGDQRHFNKKAQKYLQEKFADKL